MLEKKLGLKNNEKMKKKVTKKIEMEGMGVGFLDFLDEITETVKDNKKFKQKEYDFLDETKEVALDEAAFSSNKVESDEDDQEFSGMEDESDSDEEMEEE